MFSLMTAFKGALNFPGGGDVRKLEQSRFNFRSVNNIVGDLMQIYKENPSLFDIPTFTQKHSELLFSRLYQSALKLQS